MKFLDAFINMAARLGRGASPLADGNAYVSDFFTQNVTELEAAYRSSWIVGKVVDVVAEDMTRAGIELGTGFPPDDIAKINLAWQRLQIQSALCDGIRWARLYGGALGVLLIDGDDMARPLDLSTVGPGAFRGLLVLDRWQVSPSLSDPVTEFGPHFGLPQYYRVTASGADGHGDDIRGALIHYSRCVRFVGVRLPYRQRMMEQGWGESVVERLRDRLTNYDSSSQGAAQLMFRAYLRRYGVKGLREILAQGGMAEKGLMAQLALIRDFQSSEGLTLTDAEDAFDTYSYSFAGVADVLAEQGQQISGAADVPLVRMFGQSPRGFSTGDTDLRNYYDMIRSRQEADLRDPTRRMLAVVSMSELHKPLPDDFSFSFVSLWQLTEEQKAAVAGQDAARVAALVSGDVFSRAQALADLRQSSAVSGRHTNISDRDIAEAADEPPHADLTALAGAMPDLSGAEAAHG